MSSPLVSPAAYTIAGFPFFLVTLALTLFALGLFVFVIIKRMVPLFLAAPAYKLDRPLARILNVLKIWLGQLRHPRYFFIGLLHIVIFAGFLILSIHTLSLAGMGLVEDFYFPGFEGPLKSVYLIVKNYMATFVLVACILAIVRRIISDPERYHVPPQYGKEHKFEAFFILCMISNLMITDALFEAAFEAAAIQGGDLLQGSAPLSLTWLLTELLVPLSKETLQVVYIVSYLLHDLTFFFFLCFLPFGKHFHVFTSLFNVFFMRVDKGVIKPVRYDIPDDKIEKLESFGVKQLLDFTWKDLLDFYSCVDCGRCSDNCPATTVGSPLSPRFISIKGRDLLFEQYPVFGKRQANGPLIGSTYIEPEIWACTTCGACEQECPVGIEYIDKIVDLRRGMVDDGSVPQTLQKPLKSMEKRGNPFGKTEKKRTEWISEESFASKNKVKLIQKAGDAKVLYFVDSISSYDERMQNIARANANILKHLDVNFGILGKDEKDAGNEARRFGEELLFQELRAYNTEKIKALGVEQIIASDPHAYNVLKNEYQDLPPVNHVSQFIAEAVKSGTLKLKAAKQTDAVYTYHDPCYLGRHNDLYKDPRFVVDAIPGIKRIEMKRSYDRSFCCGGGGLMLFYELEAETRMGVVRCEMARENGANTIVTACPFCLVNIADAIKVSGLEKQLSVVDLSELVEMHLE